MRRLCGVPTVTRWSYGTKPAIKREKTRQRARIIDLLPRLLNEASIGDDVNPDVPSHERFRDYLIQMAIKEPKTFLMGLTRILSSELKEDRVATKKVKS
jgi:hypothetical protein